MFANCVQVTVVKRKCEHLLACLAQQNTLSGLPLWCIQGNFILNFFPSKILNYFFDQFNTLVPGTFCSVPYKTASSSRQPSKLGSSQSATRCKTLGRCNQHYIYRFTVTQSQFRFTDTCISSIACTESPQPGQLADMYILLNCTEPSGCLDCSVDGAVTSVGQSYK